MVYTLAKRCRHLDCNKQASFGQAGTNPGNPLRPARSPAELSERQIPTVPRMQQTTHVRTTRHQNCDPLQPPRGSFGPGGCEKQKVPRARVLPPGSVWDPGTLGLVNLQSRRCQHLGCPLLPSFGTPGSKTATHCLGAEGGFGLRKRAARAAQAAQAAQARTGPSLWWLSATNTSTHTSRQSARTFACETWRSG